MSVDFSDPEVNREPFPILHEIRDYAPVVYNPITEWWMTTSYRNVMKVLSTEARFRPDSELLDSLFGAHSMEAIDNPSHDEVRSIWNAQLLRPALEAWEGRLSELVAEQVDPAIERMRAGETVEAANGMCRAIPTLAVAGLLGLPKEDFPEFGAWARGIGLILDARGDSSARSEELIKTGGEAMVNMKAYVTRMVALRKQEGNAEDMLGMMANGEADITDDERIANVVQFVFAGQDTTTRLMSLTLVALWEHPDQRAALAADHSLIPQAIEEVVRWQSPVFSNWRTVRGGDFEFGDIVVPEGEKIVNMHGGANRDPSRWDDPDKFDVFREARQHAGFGFGLHSCIGLNLARLETKIWLEQLLDAVPEYDVAVEEVEFGHNFCVRGPVAVPLRLS
jgi:cytochrome P450